MIGYYDEIISNIKDLKKSFKESENEKINELNKNALELFNQLESYSLKELNTLKNSQEWQNLTIAFYGETNAGKSTIIEALRIYFKEESKIKQQKEFDEIFIKYSDKLQNYEENFIQIEQEINKLENQEKECEEKIKNLKNKNLFYKIIIFLNLSKTFNKTSSLLKNIKNQLELKKEQKNQLLQTKENFNNERKDKQDGQIIGDGRSDFTRKINSYNFYYNNENFTILDVPGIEGNEKIVIDEISKATKKAHVIFYIKKEPTPPQKGDSEKKGTIEKIQEQLNAQTEVYMIYNKPITNPRTLNRELISENEMESLKVLDEKMREILGNNYKETKIISAQIAFYALATKLSSNSRHFEQKSKFLEKYKEEELLEKSNFINFVDFIGNELLINTKNKIKISNYNKALKVVENFISNIKIVIEEQIKPLLDEIIKDKKNTSRLLDISLKNFISDLKNESSVLIDGFENNTRNFMYTYIDRNVKDKEFQEKFKNELDLRIPVLTKNIENKFKELEKNFDEKIKKDLEAFRSKIRDNLSNMAKISLNNEFDLSINIHSGLEKGTLFISSAGLAALGAINWWNPVGWFVLAGGILSGIIGIGKAIRKMFSSEYKKSQQRQAVEDSLYEICQKFKEDLEGQLKANESKINEPIQNIKQELKQPILYLEYSIKNLETSKENLNTIKEKIKGDMQ